MLHSLALSCITGISQQTRFELFRHYGDDLAQLLAHPGDMLGDVQPGMRDTLRQTLTPAAVSSAYDRANREIDFCQKHSIRILRYGEQDYPYRLAQCEDAPLHLFYRGKADLCQQPCISIVGTRQITSYGKDMCDKFVRELAAINPHIIVISGLAYGVDIHAHRASLAHNLATVGVVAHGLDTLYPPLHRQTAREMTVQGGILTEYMSGVAPDKAHFVRRNRIVAGLSAATLVVESAEKGGALITARLAKGYNREVFAIPGRINDPYSAGCNNLIVRREAHPVCSGEDIARILEWNIPDKASEKAEPNLFETALNQEQQRIVSILRQYNEPLGTDEIARLLGIAAHAVRSQLVDMEINGIIRPHSGNRYGIAR